MNHEDKIDPQDPRSASKQDMRDARQNTITARVSGPPNYVPASFRPLIDEWVVRADEAEALREKVAGLSRENLGLRENLEAAIFRARVTLGVAAAFLAMSVILLVM